MATHGWMKVGTVDDVVTVIRTWRYEERLSLSQLGERAGLSKGYISQLEHGGRGAEQPSLMTCVNLLNALGFELHIVRKDGNDNGPIEP